jgi:hypothetical protein
MEMEPLHPFCLSREGDRGRALPRSVIRRFRGLGAVGPGRCISIAMNAGAPLTSTSAPTRSLRPFLTAAFKAWHAAGIPFLVLRNHEQLPDSTSNDVDVLLSPARLPEAERRLVAAARQAGYRLHHRVCFDPVSLFFHPAALSGAGKGKIPRGHFFRGVGRAANVSGAVVGDPRRQGRRMDRRSGPGGRLGCD